MSMSIWRIEGTARIDYVEYCGCEWCQGHDEHTEVVVCETVEGATEEEALDAVASILKKDYLDDERPRVKWINGPVVNGMDHMQDRLMRLVGHPTLPGFS